MNDDGESSSYAVGLLCSLGLFIAGYVFYSSSLIEAYYAAEFHLSSWQIGIAQSAVPFGAMLGAVLAGRLADQFGRNKLLIFTFMLLAVTGIFAAFVFDFYSLCASRLISGVLAGTLYPLCAAYLTEMSPSRRLAKQSAILMFINCMAAPFGCLLVLFLSQFCNDFFLWRMMSLGFVFPAILAYFYAKKLPESNEWQQTEALLSKSHQSFGLNAIFSQANRSITFCLLGAWFLMDVAYYGINFFVPYLLQIMSIDAQGALSSQTILGTLIINVFFMLGALAAVFVVEKVNLIALQKYGFLFASLSLFLLAGYFYLGLQQGYLIVLLFVIFNIALNIGPDVTTYLFSATSYPVEIRGTGHGFNAGIAKFGSFLGVLFLPRMQDIWGYQSVILFLSILLFLAYLLTIKFSQIKNSKQVLMEGVAVYETN